MRDSHPAAPSICGRYRQGASGGPISFRRGKKSEKESRQRKPIPRRFPLESFPDGQGRNPAGFPPLDPLSGGWGTGVLHETTGPAGICGDAAACGIGRIPAPVYRRAPWKRKRALPAVWSAAQRRIYHPLFPRRGGDEGRGVSRLPFASAIGGVPPAVRFLSSGERKPPKGTFVVADLAGCADAVYVRAAPACRRSVAPPLPDEAYASPGLWEMRSPLETLPDGQGRNRAAVSPIGSSFRGRGDGSFARNSGTR